MLRGKHQKNGTSPAVPFLHLAGADLAGDDAGDELGGGQSSGVIGVIETEGATHGTQLLRHLCDGLKLLVASEGRADHRRAAGDELQRRISSSSDGTRPRRGDRRGYLRGKMRKLTRSAVVALDCSGTAWRGRTPATSFGDPRKKTTASRRFTASRR